MLASLLVAIGVVLAVLGVMRSVTGDEAQKLPQAIERIDPVRSAVRVPNQTPVFVDLLQGYTGVLVIDGLELVTTNVDDVQRPSVPGEQITLPATTLYEPGNATLTFTPSGKAAITSFTEGNHTATVIYWKLIDGRGASLSYTWTFSVF